MITLPSKFQDELNKSVNTPSFLAILAEAEGVLSNEQTLQADWAAASAYNQVDWLSQVGTVNLASVLRPELFLSLSYFLLKKQTISIPYYALAYQSFKQETGAAKTLTSVKGFFRVENTGGGTETLECKLFAADKTTQIGTTVTAYLTATAGAEATFDFSSQGLSIAHNTTYWVQFKAYYYTTFCGYVAKAGLFQNLDFYANGQMDVTTVIGSFPGAETTYRSNVGDAYFQVNLAGGYYKTTGYLTTQTMDLGSTPTGNGEWIIEDIKPTGTTLTYQAWASATGAFAGEEINLGAIVDATPITNLKRYYRVKATFGANGDQSLSPSMQSIKATFLEGSFRTFATHPDTGYEPALMSVSSLSTSIDTFKASSIGQITLTLSLCDSVSTYLATKKPKNKTVKIKAGFIADGFTEADYIDYFWGQIDGWNITAKDEVVITVKDFSKEWSVDVPETTSAGVPATIWQGHPVDMMLDVLKNHINVRDSKIDGASFGSVKEALSGWVVFRTLVKDTVRGDELMEELRKITSTYYLPQATGQIKLKRWNADEASIAAFTDADFISKQWDSAAKQIVNRVEHYYGWDGEGDDAGDYNHITIGTDPVSQIDWAEVSSKELKDKWTPATQTAQSADYTNKILLRYANPPSTLIVDVDLKHIALEVGDMVTVTTYRAPSTDMTGIANIKFQIINKNLNFAKNTLSLTLLESHSSVNTQVEPPVAQPTAYDFPDHVVDLVIVEQEYINKDGAYTPIITVTYELPTNSTYWDHAIIQTSIDSGATFQDYGLDYLSGNGFLIDAKKIGGYVGGTLEVKAISVNTQGIAAPYATAPTRSITKVGAVIITAPAVPRGLSIEGNPDPNNTQWDGLRFALTWWKASQTGGAGVEGGLGAGGFEDPYWQGDEYELVVGGVVSDSGITKEARYDYIYGDGYLAYLDAKIAATNGTLTFRIRRVSLNLASEWSTITITQAAPVNPVSLTSNFEGRNLVLSWTKATETDFKYYELILNGVIKKLTDPFYTYTFEENIKDNITADPSITYSLKTYDVYGNASGAVTGTFTNATPATPSGLTSDFTGRNLIISWTKAPETDIAYYELILNGITKKAAAPFHTYAFEENIKDNTTADPSITYSLKTYDIYGNASSALTGTFTNPVPTFSPVVTATQWMDSVSFEWTQGSEKDIAFYRYRDKIDAGAWSSWTDTTRNSVMLFAEAGQVIYLEVKSVDVFGQELVTAATANGTAQGLNIQPSDINDFAITASKIFTKIPIISGDTWTDNSPSAGRVAWNAHTLYYNGVAYAITASDTDLKYIYWTGGTTYTASNTNPVLTDGQFVIATNISGLHDLAWNAIANQVIGSAYIQNLAVQAAHIEDATISTAKIADLAVSTAKIADAAISTVKIGDAQITAAKIVDATITGAKIASATITTALIADAQITGAKIASATITDAQIASLNADKIVAGSIRGIGVYGSTHATKGNYLTATAGAGDGTLYVKDTTDFPSSGSGWIIDSANDRDAISWTGKTSTTLTGCSGVLAHTVSSTNVPVVVPAIKAMVMADVANEQRFFGDRGDSTIEELISLGISTVGADSVIGKFGSANSTHVGLQSRSFSTTGVHGQSNSGTGVYGQSDSSRGVYGYSNSDSGVLGESVSFNGLYGASGTGMPLKLYPKASAPTTNVSDGGVYYNSTDYKFYGRSNGAWVALN